MKPKLTRTQELALIDLGLQHVLDTLTVHKKTRRTPWNKGIRKAHGNTKHRWSDAQREKFKATMKQKWAERKKKQK
jgi:hypothetical protein